MALTALRDLPRDAKVLVTAFLVVLTIGYSSGLAYVFATTRMAPRGIGSHYAGSEDETEMKFPKGPIELVQTTHNHVLSLSLLFGVLGALLLGARIPSRLRRALIIESFAAILTTFSALWLVRYVSRAFSWLALASGLAMAISFYAMVGILLFEVWRRGGGESSSFGRT
jgi:hypothetical protein